MMMMLAGTVSLELTDEEARVLVGLIEKIKAQIGAEAFEEQGRMALEMLRSNGLLTDDGLRAELERAGVSIN